MKKKVVVDLDFWSDKWEMADRFEEFYTKLKELRQFKTGGTVSRKAALKVFEGHLEHVAGYYLMECWDDMIEENIEGYLDKADKLAAAEGVAKKQHKK